MIAIKTNSSISLLYFLIATLLGIVLRFFPVTAIAVNYRYLVHTHSHVALLGWVYLAITTLIFHLYIHKKATKKHHILFWCTQVTIVGMLLSFPVTGYAFYSILFSTLFLFCSYFFYALFKRYHTCNTTNYSYKFINASLLFMVFSSIGPWLLGIIITTLGSNSHWYKNAIYFYLHFQYNGWFILALIGIFLKILEKNKINVSKKELQQFYKLMISSCVLTVFLSFLWIKPPPYIYLLAAIGSVLQVFGLLIFYKILKNSKLQLITKITPFNFQLLQFVFALLVLKIIMQLLTAIPYFAEITYQIVNFVIGYLHLTFLGIVSISLLVFLNIFKAIVFSKFYLKIYLLGFVISEALIFYKGICNWQQWAMISNYYAILVAISTLMPLALLVLFIKNIKHLYMQRKQTTTQF